MRGRLRFPCPMRFRGWLEFELICQIPHPVGFDEYIVLLISRGNIKSNMY